MDENMGHFLILFIKPSMILSVFSVVQHEDPHPACGICLVDLWWIRHPEAPAQSTLCGELPVEPLHTR